MSLFIFERLETQLDKTEEIHEPMCGPGWHQDVFGSIFSTSGVFFSSIFVFDGVHQCFISN